MGTTNENIRQLLEMLDNPDAYTEQEIQDIIHRDEDTHTAYCLMVEAKRSCRHRQHQNTVDVDAAWQRLYQKLQPKQQDFGWMKIAASLIGVLLVTGIAFAAIWSLIPSPSPKGEGNGYMQTSDTVKHSTPLSHRRGGGGEASSVIYDNIPLEKMLPEIAAHYNVEVTFANEAVRSLRFHFVWNPKQDIADVVKDLNRFEHLHATLKDHQLIVE